MFVSPPTADATTPGLPTPNQNDTDLYRLSLTSDAPANLPVLEYEMWLQKANEEAAKMNKDQGGELDRLLRRLEGQFQDLQRRKIEEWLRQQEGLRLRGRLKNLSKSLPKSLGFPLVETGAYM